MFIFKLNICTFNSLPSQVCEPLGVFGLKDATEQGPVNGPRLDGFGTVGAGATHALLADVDLPSAEIGGGWFHGFRGWGLDKYAS